MINKNEKIKKDNFSKEEGNLEIITVDTKPQSQNTGSDAVNISKDGIDIKRGGNIIIGSLNIATAPIKKRSEKHYKNSKFHLIADVVLALIVVVLFVSMFIIQNLNPKLDIAVNAISANEIITSGEIETFEIEYENNSNEIIDNATIAIHLPKGFVLKEAVPKNIFNNISNTFKLGDLGPKSKGSVKVSGLILAETNSRGVLSYSFNYLNNSKKENILDSFVYIVEDSSISIEWNAPREVYKDINFISKLIIKNNSTRDLEKEIEVSFVDSGLEIKNINIKELVLSNNIISLEGLKANNSIEIEIEAVSITKKSDILAKVSSFIDTGEVKLRQQDVIKKIKVLEPKFDISITPANKTIKDGEKVSFKIDYKNEEEGEIKDLRFNLNSLSSAFSISEISLISEGGVALSGDSIILNKNLAENESGSIFFEARFKKKNIKTNQELGVLVQVSYNFSDRIIEYKIPSGKIRMLSDLQISSKGYYYSPKGDQLGIGPLPPAVSVPTRYWIFWEFDNLGNNLENLNINANLSDNVFWTDTKSLTAGKIRFAQIGRKVVWIVDEISKEEERGRAGFELELVPKESDRGNIVNLLEDIEYSAFDVFAGKEISGKLEVIDTNLQYDSLASGKGEVIKLKILR